MIHVVVLGDLNEYRVSQLLNFLNCELLFSIIYYCKIVIRFRYICFHFKQLILTNHVEII